MWGDHGAWGRGQPFLSPCLSSVPRYEVQLGDSLLSMSGCSLECWKDVVQKACCPGYWGSQCYGTGEGPTGHLCSPSTGTAWPPGSGYPQGRDQVGGGRALPRATGVR